MSSENCPVCNSADVQLFKQMAGSSYYECISCELLFVEPEVLKKIDAGKAIVNYSSGYWEEEIVAARERSWGASLARVAEVILYATIPIGRFIDIGSGPGYLLDALQYQLPSSSHLFYANELFPPAPRYRTRNPNYFIGDFSRFDFSFDAGCCIEVIEHLTPAMVKKLFCDLAKKSRQNSIYIFNTGLSDYIKQEDIEYLDPLRRGHIIGWSIKSLQHLVESIGFQILPIPGKKWAFIAEYQATHSFDSLEDRIWKALPENVNILRDAKTGQLMYVLGLETARAYT